MPTTTVRLSRDEALELHLRCVGLAGEELGALYRDLRRELPERHAFRNPSPLVFDAKAVHELLVYVPWAVIGSTAGKRAIEKAVDIVAAIVERRLSVGDSNYKKTVTIYGPDGKAHCDVVVKPEKIRRR